MSVTTPQTSTSQRRRRRPQVSLSTVLLATAVIAVWIAYRKALNESQTLQAKVARLQSIARELQVERPDEFAVVQRLPTKYGELIWDVYVPGDDESDNATIRTTELCLAMDQIPSNLEDAGNVEPLQMLVMPAGRHVLELDYQRLEASSELVVLMDGETVMQVSRPKEWESRTGWSSSGGQSFDISRSVKLDEPLVLHQRRFMRDLGNGSSRTPDEPCEGILLWVRSKTPSNLNP